MDERQRDALQRLLRRVDEVRGLEVLPPGGEPSPGDATDVLLRTAESLVDELERSRRRLIETNVQLVSLREVAHSMVSSGNADEATQTVTVYLHRAFGFEDVFLALVNREEALLEGTWTRKAGSSHASLPFRVPLISEPEGVLAKAVWQHRPFTIHDAALHPPFSPPADSTLGDVLELEQLARIGDREHPVEHLLQPLVLPAQGVDVHLEKITEALQLDLEQVRNLEIPLRVDLREALPFLPACCLQGLPAFRLWGSDTPPGASAYPRNAGGAIVVARWAT